MENGKLLKGELGLNINPSYNDLERRNQEFENVIQQDPTLRFFLREVTMDFDKIEHQSKIMGSCVVIAIARWIDLKYK